MMRRTFRSVRFIIAKPAYWIEISRGLSFKPSNVKSRTAGAGFPVINMGAFVWKGGAVGQKKNGLPKHSHTRTTQLTR